MLKYSNTVQTCHLLINIELMHCILTSYHTSYIILTVIPLLIDIATEKGMNSCISFVFCMQFRLVKIDYGLIIFNYKSTILMKLFILNINLVKQHKKNNK